MGGFVLSATCEPRGTEIYGSDMHYVQYMEVISCANIPIAKKLKELESIV
jgi:hypothetical protein